jgi:beta-lactamase class A
MIIGWDACLAAREKLSVRNRSALSLLRFFSLGLLLISIILVALQLVRFSRVRSYLPAGLTVAGVPVGGLDREQAAERLMEVYSVPVLVRYNGASILLQPSVVDFTLDVENMLALANLERTQKQFWEDFWDYLWGRTEFPTQIPLRATFSDQRLRAYLVDVAARYDQPALPAMPVPGSASFDPGKPGQALDIEGALPQIEAALYSLENREVELPLTRVDPSRPAFQNLDVLLKQTLQVGGFDGLAGIYLLDINSGQEMHFAIQNGEDLAVEPDIAFTASSIIKIPIMVTVFQRLNDQNDSETMKLLQDMITLSGNEAADWLMDRAIEPQRAPLDVTEDMQAIGLKNTFLAGYFTFGSPLLALIETPANTRPDISTDPDPYSQTTPSDIGMLLNDIYQCAKDGGGTLPAVFPGQITQEECQTMSSYLIKNRLPVLLTAGLPEATPIAHKHGWVTVNGIINTIGDAGIVYSPGGDYILVVFLYHPEQLIWESASALIAQLSQVVYNFYNIPQT